MSSEIVYPVTVDQFKTWFQRDFPFSTDIEEGITDQDITKAFAEAMFIYNKELFDENEQSVAFMYLAAHYLVIDLKNSSMGLKGAFNGLMSNKSVGSVSVGYTMPSWIMENPLYSLLAQTPYGVKYLSLVVARSIGNFGVVKGATYP